MLAGRQPTAQDRRTLKGKLMIDKKIAFIGAGQMGSALLKGMLRAQALAAERVWVSDKDPGKTSPLKKEWGVTVVSGNRQAAQQAGIIFLAIKPQQLDEVVDETRDVVREDHLLISIIAGVSTKSLEGKFGKGIRVVRVMPNSPALVGKSVSVISRGEFASESEEQLVGQLFSAVGEVVFLGEEYQNRVTALSGSGPAYFYLLVEELIKAGESMGLSRDVASQLIAGTIIGAGQMLKETGKSPAELCEIVTSPGGTTEAALRVFKSGDFGGMVRRAVEAAVKRAEELGR